MEREHICPICGQPIAAVEPDCPRCRSNFFLGPDTILILTLAGLLALFVVTGLASQAYHAKDAALGEQWYERGTTDLSAGRVEPAIVDLRTALIYARSDERYDLSLAQALMAADRTGEAKSYLMTLREREPDNAQVNLDLGRLAAGEGQIDDALRYYHSAMYDDWPGRDPAEARRAVRLELYRFLIRQGDKAQAQAELVAMAALLPPDPALYTEVGQLFMEVGDYSRAGFEFEAALKLDRNPGEATLVGAGESEFYLGNYESARRHLERALREKPDDTRVKKLQGMLEDTNLVLSADPFDPTLPEAERDRRVIEAFDQAQHRLALCTVSISGAGGGNGGPQKPMTSAGSGLEALAIEARGLQPQVRADALRKNPDEIPNIMRLVFQIEAASAEGCGTPQPLDHALLLLAAQHGGA
jgi:tetratricopeptide (TPR) repeat protein